MEIDVKEKTAHNASVGADAGQSIQKDSDNSIPASEAKGNGEMENLEEMYRKMQRMADPRYLHTLTMTELFQTSYKSRPPIIENLLHSGAYILAGAPKIGKSFLVAQIAYLSEPGRICGAAKSTRQLSSTLRWRMTSSASRTGCL